MLKTIITAMITYLATSVDEIPVLFLLYTKADNRGKGKVITFSYFVGTILLILVGLLGAFGIGQIPEKWLIGLVGLVPIVMGIKTLVKGEEDEEEKAVEFANKYKTLLVQVLFITLGLGADDVGVYIPLFTTLSGWEIMLMLGIFLVGTAVLCWVSYKLTKIDKLVDLIEDYENIIVGGVFTAIGVFVMAECGTFSKLVSLF